MWDLAQHGHVRHVDLKFQNQVKNLKLKKSTRRWEQKPEM